MTRHIRAWKETEVKELTQLADKYPVVAVCDLQEFPASLFQVLRKKLYGKAVVKVSKTRVVQRAFSESKIKNSKLNDFVKESIALVFTEMNPFELSSFLKKNKGSAPAKVGTIAPMDLMVPAGDTGLPPGPALSDLKGAGLQVKVQGATIFITEDRIVTKKGEPVSKAVAGTLQKLDIKPLKVGLNLVAALEAGQVFEGTVLDIDTDQVFSDFRSAHSNAFNLAVEIGYLSSETVPLLVNKAFLNAMNLAINANVLNSETIEHFLQKANLQALALKEKVPEALKEEKKEETKEESKTEAPAEDKKEEPAKEEPKPEEKPAEEKAEEKKEEAPAEEKPAEDKKEAPVEEKPAEEKKEEGKKEEKPTEEKK